MNVWFQKNPFPPDGRSLEIPRGRGVLKSNFLEKMYENKLEFPGGRGAVQNKKPSVGGVWIFWNCTMLFNVSLNIINQIVPKQDREWS